MHGSATGDPTVTYPHAYPAPQGLYDPAHEHDACGVAFVATLTGEASHDIVRKGITALLNLDHRGAAGAETNSGDGAGILIQVPDAFLREVTREAGFELPAPRSYAVGTAFLPGDPGDPSTWPRPGVGSRRSPTRRTSTSSAGATCPWRPDRSARPRSAVMPTFAQLFVAGTGQPGHRDGAGAARVLPAQAGRDRDRRLLPVAVLAHADLQGHAHHRPARRGLPRPA